MFLDASAIVAIIVGEAGTVELAGRVGRAVVVRTSPLAIYESVLGVSRAGNMPITTAQILVDRLLDTFRAEIMPITAEVGRSAVSAFERYGRGRHPAALNMGDCFAYACAQELDMPVLCKGDDFPQTDIALA
jgi:ribonuclease VapC